MMKRMFPWRGAAAVRKSDIDKVRRQLVDESFLNALEYGCRFPAFDVKSSKADLTRSATNWRLGSRNRPSRHGKKLE